MRCDRREEIYCCGDDDSDDSVECTFGKKTCQTTCQSNWWYLSTLEAVVIMILSFLFFFGATVVLVQIYELRNETFAWQKFEYEKCAPPFKNMHPLLECVGFVTLGGLGIVQFGVSRCLSKPSIKALHQLLYLTSAILIGWGTLIAINCNEEKKGHFTTIHGLIGITAVALFYIVFGFGFLKFVFLLAFGPISCCLRASCKPIHAALGVGAFWSGVTALVSAVPLYLVKDPNSTQILEATHGLGGVEPIFYDAERKMLIRRVKLRRIGRAPPQHAFVLILMVCGLLVCYSVITRISRNV